MKNILVTGATGLIGSALCEALIEKGYRVYGLTRNPESARTKLALPIEWIEGDLESNQLPDLNMEVHGVFHLAGEPLAEGKWTAEKKEKILKSRLDGSQNILNWLSKMNRSPEFILSASAIGFYGSCGDEVLDENSKPGNDFLAEICQAWERPFSDIKSPQLAARVVCLRIGLVLSRAGGALPRMLTPFQMGVGGTLGSGKQWQSWIHIDDLVSLMCHCLEKESYRGAVNGVAPNPVTNKEFTRLLGKQLQKPAVVPVPQFALRALFGELADVLFASQRVLPRTAQRNEFGFQFPNLESAFSDLIPDSEGDVYQVGHFIPRPLPEVFQFFSSAQNLEKITPEFLNFKILKSPKAGIKTGSEIQYRLKLYGVPLRWKTLIDDFVPNDRFVDIQVKGPYKTWHHTHTFKAVPGGTLMKDRVRYELPLGMVGRAGGIYFVRQNVKSIFEFRRQALNKIFA